MARKEIAIAGIKINLNFSDSRGSFYSGISIFKLPESNNLLRAEIISKPVEGLPEDCRFYSIKWSPSNEHFAILLVTETNLELWVVKVEEGFFDSSFYNNSTRNNPTYIKLYKKELLEKLQDN